MGRVAGSFLVRKLPGVNLARRVDVKMNITAFAAGLVLAFAALQAAHAQTEARAEPQPQTAQQLYDTYNSYNSLVAAEADADRRKGGFGFFDGRPGTNFAKAFEAMAALHKLGEAGDPRAMFLEGMAKYAEGVKLARFPNTMGQGTLGDEDLRTSLALFKRAGDGGIPDGYYNAALQYQNAQGVIGSKLAAAEWFYRAGTGYLKAGDRDRAFNALEGMRANDKDSLLTKKLETAVRAGGPK